MLPGYGIDNVSLVRSAQQVTDRLDSIIARIRALQAPHMRKEGAAESGPRDVVLFAHGHLLRAFVKRWLGYPMDFGLSMMLEPGGVGVLRWVFLFLLLL